MKTEKHYRYIEKIRQIDETLCPPVESLFKLAARRAPSNDRLAQRLTSEGNKRPVFFPPWVSEYNTYPSEGVYLLTRASCCSALLRIWRIRRRFPDLKKALEERSYLEESSDLKNLIEDTFVPPSDEKKKNFVECAFRLHSGTSGTLNPLTASQVLSVLMDAGERRAHSGIGFLAFFGMAWSLHRRFPDSAAQGAYLGPWNPTAYVTAKCLIPIRSLYSVCKLRAELFEKIQEAVKELDELAKQDCDPCSFWRFTAKLDQLSDRLSEMGQIAIHREALQNCEKEVSALAGRHGPQINAKTPLKDLNDVTKLLAEMLREICKKTKEVADEAQPVVDGAKDLIVAKLKDSSSQWDGKLGEDLRVQLGREWIDPKYDGKYVSDLYEAAKKAHEECERALKILTDSSQDCADMLKVNQGDEALHSVQSAFSCLATANKKLANLFDETFRNNARWCRAVVDREIAHISAKNYTDFDPAELASGIAVAVRWEEMNSSLEVRDAIAKALVGAHPDGSWKPGQPFYTTGRGLAVIPITSDIIWTLATAVAQYPEIAVADRVFERYVDWLSRTRTQAPFPPSNSEQSERINVIGWPSDRARESRNVDLWATALAIHALLEIRDLFEYRLWQICNERFTVVQPKQRLGQLAPVDLGAKHEARIQRKLAQFSRRARQAYDDADYALVLHGPPGSSKTSIAEALAAEMWGAPAGASRQRSRLIRITPADFTRRGEERLDYEARVIFELLQSVRGVTVLFDEIDDLLRRRQPGTEPSFIKLVVPHAQPTARPPGRLSTSGNLHPLRHQLY